MSGTRRKPGRLGPFVDGYRVWLLEAGYTPQTVRMMLKRSGPAGSLDGCRGCRDRRADCHRRRVVARCAAGVLMGIGSRPFGRCARC